MDEPVEDGIREGRFSDDLMPCADGKLACDQRRSCAVAILDDLHEITSLAGIEAIRPPVIKDQQLCLRQGPEDTWEASVSMGQFQFVKEARDTFVEDSDALPAGRLDLVAIVVVAGLR